MIEVGPAATTRGAIRALDHLHEERKAVVAVASRVVDLARGWVYDAASNRALRSPGGTAMRETLADLTDAQRDAERHDACQHESGEDVLARFLDALRAERKSAVSAGENIPGRTPERAAHVRRANAYTWAINTLRPLATEEIAIARDECTQAEEWLTRPYTSPGSR